MNDSIVIQSRIDSDRLDRIEAECAELIYQQRLLYNERWYASKLFTRGMSFLRLLGLSLSIVGAVISMFYLVYPSTCPKWYLAEANLLFFVFMGVLFYFLPRIQTRYHAWFRNAGKGGSQRMARRFLARARKQVPFDAKYEVNGNRIRYLRGKDDKWQQIWSGEAKGYALLGKNVTLLLRKPTSLLPRRLILSDDPQVVASLLQGFGIEYKTSFRN